MNQPPYAPQPGRDPRAPFGAVPPSVSIDSYAPPRPRIALVVAIVVAVVALAAALVVLTSPADPPPAPGNSTKPSATATPSWGKVFQNMTDSLKGQWEVVSHEWTNYGLRVQVRIKVEYGTLRPSFAMYANDASEAVEPVPTPDSPGFENRMDSGDDRTSWLTFSIAHGDSTLILTDLWSDQLSAIAIAA